jgi:hypothetical protein
MALHLSILLPCDWKEDQSAIRKLQRNLGGKELGVKASWTVGNFILEIFPVKQG